MKTHIFASILLLMPLMLMFTSIAGTVDDFKIGRVIGAGDKILKWECDVNGDGKNEVFLSFKSIYTKDVEDHETPSWDVYISQDAGSYIKPEGVENTINTISVGGRPQIDPEACFIGQITQLGKRGIATLSYVTQRLGGTTATIYAYTLEGDHLKRTQLTQYNPD